jgi:hypothetical protein
MGAIWAVEPPPDSRLAKAGAIRKDRVGSGDRLDVKRSGRPMGAPLHEQGTESSVGEHDSRGYPGAESYPGITCAFGFAVR